MEALRRRKVGAIIAISFARIFFRNALNLGIPLFTRRRSSPLCRTVMRSTLDLTSGILVAAVESAYQLPVLPDFAREILSAGGIVAYVREHGRFPERE